MTKQISVAQEFCDIQSYNELLQQAVSVIENARYFVAKQVNTTAIQTRWHIGKLLHERKIESGHGDGVVNRLASDLKKRYPDMGMSPRNLWNMKRFFLRYSDVNSKLLRAVAVLPWSQNLLILSHDLDDNAVMYYGKESKVDILFFHRGLKALVALDLEIGSFISEHADKINYFFLCLTVLNSMKVKINQSALFFVREKIMER